MKQLIGIFRIVLVLVIFPYFGLDIFDGIEVQNFISKFIHGSYSPELRDTGSVVFLSLVYFLILTFYIIQSVFYIFVGSSLEGKNTSLTRFLYYVVRDLKEVARDPHFWSSDSSGGNLNNIEKVLSYRDNKMTFMSNKEAAEYMKGTGHIDLLMSRPDLKQSRKTLSYLNNKMTFMDNETALNFIKEKK
jgi:hypothetical protein